MRFETTVEIDAPQDAVWNTLVDVERWPEWTASMTEVKRVDGEVLAPGSRVRVKQPRMPALMWEVTELAPGRSFTWRSTSPGVTTVGSHLLTSAASDRVAVTLGVRQSGALASVVALLTSGRTRRYVQMEALGLKTRCEGS